MALNFTLVFGKFSKCNQHVLTMLDHVYTDMTETYKAVPLLDLGQSDHL